MFPEFELRFLEAQEGKAKWDPAKKLWVPYRDQIGKLTIYVGHLIRTSTEDFSDGITDEVGEGLLIGDLTRVTQAIAEYVTVPLTAHQRAGIRSWLFNVGVGYANPERSTPIRMLNLGRYDMFPKLLEMYDVADGQHKAYLLARRKAEGALFALPDDASRDDVQALAQAAGGLKAAAMAAVGLQFGRFDLLPEDPGARALADA